MSTSIIVLDTNILTRSPFLDSGDWNRLHEHTTDWGLSFTVPEVVFMETVNVVQRQWKPDLDRMKRLSTTSWGSRLDKELQAVVDAAAERSESYESALRSRIEELKIGITPLPTTIDHLDIARRASERRAPYGSAGNGKEEYLKDGYRDTLIWLTTLAVAENHPACDVWFVSDNYSDFGDKREDRKDPRDTLEYPLEWHPELAPELEAKGLTNRVFYARGLGRLEEHLLAKFAPLPDAEREELWEAVDRKELDRHLIPALFAAPVEPRAAALPLDTSSATIISSVRASEAVRLTEAARRAANTWTARFNCAMNATVEVTTSQGDVSVESKPLIISGRIDINSENEVTTLKIDAIEATADDPQRRAWERADSSRRLVRKLLENIDRGTFNWSAVLEPSNDAFRKLLDGLDPSALNWPAVLEPPNDGFRKLLDERDNSRYQKLSEALDPPTDNHRDPSGTAPDKSDEPEEPDNSYDVKSED